MTAPKMVPCEMIGELVQWPRELDGTAYCSQCRNERVQTKKVSREDGTVAYVYDHHSRRAYQPRWKAAAPKHKPRPGRDPGRRR